MGKNHVLTRVTCEPGLGAGGLKRTPSAASLCFSAVWLRKLGNPHPIVWAMGNLPVVGRGLPYTYKYAGTRQWVAM